MTTKSKVVAPSLSSSLPYGRHELDVLLGFTVSELRSSAYPSPSGNMELVLQNCENLVASFDILVQVD